MSGGISGFFASTDGKTRCFSANLEVLPIDWCKYLFLKVCAPSRKIGEKSQVYTPKSYYIFVIVGVAFCPPTVRFLGVLGMVQKWVLAGNAL